MKLKKESVIEGYAAFAENGKGLCNRTTTWFNKQSLTDDIDNVTISDNKKQIEIYIDWFNYSHKKSIKFQIKKVKLIRKSNLVIIEK